MSAGDATPGDGRYSVAFPKRAWYPACPTSELRRGRAAGFTLMDTPLVAFRDGHGGVSVLLDRCPHRNLPLSMGRVHDTGSLECAYHGWRFDGAGQCTAVPGLLEGAEAAAPARAVGAYPAREQDGFVWVWADPDTEPDGDPYRLPRLTGRGSGETVFDYDLECTLHAALENALDVPHTAFLHAGIFRGGEQNEITAVRREIPGGLEVQYLGEPAGLGPIRPRPGSDLTFEHWDRYLFPSIAQVEYRVEGWVHIVNTILHLPVSPFRTKAWFVVRYWTRLPAAAVKPIVSLRGRQILRQDADVLARQTDHIRRLGGERYTSTDLDLVGNAIWRLLRRAERAERAPGPDGDAAGEPSDDGEPTSRSVTFRA
jgi:nitrite reductase/ring-hydroxylating ferredoxin subunit